MRSTRTAKKSTFEKRSTLNKRVILHVDMDAFFASVELLDHPEWRGKPLIVGSAADERGVVSTCSYEARKFGVHSAMPSRTAYKLCPHAIFIPPNMRRYSEVSQKIFEIFSNYTPYVEGVSIDEAFLDITGSIHLFGSAENLGRTLMSEIREKCSVTCSVGIAPNRLLAKIGSEENKPNGLTMMPFEERGIVEFLKPKKIGILWGIGQKTVELLRPYGILTCGDLQNLSVEKLSGILGSEDAAEHLLNHAFGRSASQVYWQEESEKSVSREYTFDKDEADSDIVRERLLELVKEVGRRFRKEERWAKTARLKLRNSRFESITRQLPFEIAARDDIAFRAKALELWDMARKELGNRYSVIRLVGFGVTNIVNTPETDEGWLFRPEGDENREKRERLFDAIDRLHNQGLI